MSRGTAPHHRGPHLPRADRSTPGPTGLRPPTEGTGPHRRCRHRYSGRDRRRGLDARVRGGKRGISMLKLRSTWLAGGSALLLVVALSGLAAAAPLVADTSAGLRRPRRERRRGSVRGGGRGRSDRRRRGLRCRRHRWRWHDLGPRGGPQRLGRREELQPRRLRELGGQRQGDACDADAHAAPDGDANQTDEGSTDRRPRSRP